MTLEQRSELKDYLNNPSDYHRGVQILYGLTLSNALRDSLTNYPSPAKLRTYLEKQYNGPSGKAIESTKEESSPETESSPLPPEEHPTIIEWKEKKVLLFKELAHYYALKSEEKSKDIRFSYMKKCVEIDIELGAIHHDILFYDKYGRLPLKKSVPKAKNCTETMAQIRLKLLNLPQSINVDKKLLIKLAKQIEETENITELEALNNRKKLVQERLEGKKIELLRLRSALEELQNR